MLLFYKNDKIALNLEYGCTVKVAFLLALSIFCLMPVAANKMELFHTSYNALHTSKRIKLSHCFFLIAPGTVQNIKFCAQGS